MALVDHFKKWMRRLMVDGSNVQHQHDALEASFTEQANDIAAMEADTFFDSASGAGLDRWGFDLIEPRIANQTNTQYAGRLQQVKQGVMVDDAGIRAALDRWGLAYELAEEGDPWTFWDDDQTFYDQSGVTVKSRTIVVAFADPFGGATPTAQQKADALASANNAIADAWRVKAAGVNVIALLPASLQ